MKRHNIDGLPGITMHGKKGPDGPRGGMTFCNSEASVTFDNIVLDAEYTYSLGVAYINKDYKIIPFISNKVAPIKDDYVLNVTTSYTELFSITEVVNVPFEDISEYIAINDYSDDGTGGVSAPGFNEEVIIVGGEEEEEEEKVDNVFIKFGDSSIGYYALLKEISDDLEKIKGIDKSPSGVYSGNNELSLFIMDRLDTWNFLNGVPADIDLGVSVRTINIQRNIWQGNYTPRSVIKRSTYLIGRTPFDHYKNGEYFQGEKTSMHKYCVNILGYVYDYDNDNYRNLCTVDESGERHDARVSTNAASDNGFNTISLTLSFVNAITNKPCGNEVFNIVIHCGKHHFCGKVNRAGIGIECVKDEKGNVIETAAPFVVGGEYGNNTTWTATYSNESVLYKNEVFVSRIEKNGITTNPDGTAYIRVGIPADISSVDMAYVQISSKDYASWSDDTYFLSYQVITSLTYTGSDFDPIECRLLPKNFAQNAPAADDVITHKDFDKSIKASANSRGAQFEAKADEFVYIDTFSPTDKLPIGENAEGEEGDMENHEDSESALYKVEDVKKYLNDPEFCKAESKSFAFTQFLVTSELTEEERKKIRIEAEITVDKNVFTQSVSTCLKDLWEPDEYESEEYGYNMSTKVAIEKRQKVLLQEARNKPELFKSLFYNTRSEYGGLQNGKGSIYPYKNGELAGLTERPETMLYKMMGHIKNYSHELNFDREEIFPCTLVIKDFNEGNTKSDFVATVMIPEEVVSSATIRIYAYYKKTSSASIKMLLGETAYGSTLEEANTGDSGSGGDYTTSREYL